MMRPVDTTSRGTREKAARPTAERTHDTARILPDEPHGNPAAKPLTAGERSELRARAHALRPVVIVSGDELSGAVVAEIGRCLERHELIKIRVSGADRDRREALLAEICASTGASPVQHIGRILIAYRKRSAPDLVKKPAARPATTTRKARPAPARARRLR